MKKEQNLQSVETQALNIPVVINSALMKANLREYLDSKITAGGLYGLTIKDDDYLQGLIKVIKMTLNKKVYKRPKDKTKYIGWY